jgi:hypothetical protein
MDQLFRVLDRHAGLSLLAILLLGTGAAASFSAAVLLN